MRELYDAGIRMSLRAGKVLLWMLAALAAFCYWGASVRAGRPADITEWNRQVTRLRQSADFYYGKPQQTYEGSSREQRKLFRSFGFAAPPAPPQDYQLTEKDKEIFRSLKGLRESGENNTPVQEQ